jgi:hypothetical protein
VIPQPPQDRLQPPHSVHAPQDPVGFGDSVRSVVVCSIVVAIVVASSVVVAASVVVGVVESGMGGGASPSEKNVVKILNFLFHFALIFTNDVVKSEALKALKSGWVGSEQKKHFVSVGNEQRRGRCAANSETGRGEVRSALDFEVAFAGVLAARVDADYLVQHTLSSLRCLQYERDRTKY